MKWRADWPRSTRGLPRVSRHNSHLRWNGRFYPLIGNAIMDILDLRKEIRFVIRDRRQWLNLRDNYITCPPPFHTLIVSFNFRYILPWKNKISRERNWRENFIARNLILATIFLDELNSNWILVFPGFGDEHEYRLTKYLLDGYDAGVRPAENSSQPLAVVFGLSLHHIIDVVSVENLCGRRTNSLELTS